MAKVTAEAAKAQASALKARSVKRYDVGEKFTSVSRIKYDKEDNPISTKRLGTIEHG